LRKDKARRRGLRFAHRVARPAARRLRAAPRTIKRKGITGTMFAIANIKDEVERISAWQCIGCGRVEGPQPCVGVCQDKKVTFVSAEAYDAVAARLRLAEARLAALESLANRMALAKPRDGEWEKSYRALQDEARRALRESHAAKAS
jgi:ferredoxin